MAEEYVGRKFKTKFIENKLPEGPVDELVDFSKRLAELGFLKGIPGNYSVRVEDGFLVSAGGVEKENLTKEDVVKVVGYIGDSLSVIGLKEPSSEARMHEMIYKRYPEVNAIVHVHDEIVLEKEEKARELGFEFTRREQSYGTLKLAYEVIDALRHNNYIVMINHGVLAVGNSLESALDLITEYHNKLE